MCKERSGFPPTSGSFDQVSSHSLGGAQTLEVLIYLEMVLLCAVPILSRYIRMYIHVSTIIANAMSLTSISRTSHNEIMLEYG